MKKVSVHIAYDGPAIDTGVMDVRDLAPALLAFGDLLEECNQVLYGESSKVTAYVKSDFKTGSFQIDLEVVMRLGEQLALIIKGDQGPDAQKLAAIIGLGATGAFIAGKSLIALIKWLRGRKIKSATIIDNGMMRIETQGDYDSIEVSQDVVTLCRNPRIRKSLSDIIKPLKRKGIEKFEVREPKGVLEIIEKDEAVYFDTVDCEDEEEVVNKSTLHLRLLGVYFESGRKWEFTDGERKFKAVIIDDKFLKEIDEGVRSFSKDDVLKVELVSKQFVTKNGLNVAHEIVKVLEHKKGIFYQQLDFDSTE